MAHTVTGCGRDRQVTLEGGKTLLLGLKSHLSPPGVGRASLPQTLKSRRVPVELHIQGAHSAMHNAKGKLLTIHATRSKSTSEKTMTSQHSIPAVDMLCPLGPFILRKLVPSGGGAEPKVCLLSDHRYYDARGLLGALMHLHPFP